MRMPKCSYYGLDIGDPDVCDLLLFAKRYHNEWHSFSRDARTRRAVRKLKRGNDHFVVDYHTEQFMYKERI